MSALIPDTSANLELSEVLRFLSSAPLFSELDDALRASLAEKFEALTYRAGSILMIEGSQADSLYVLLSGRLRVLVRRGARHVVIAEVGRGEVVGEMGLLTEEPRAATVQAIRDSVVLRLSQAEFNRLVELRPRTLTTLTKLVVSRLRRTLTGKRLADAGIRTVAIIPAGNTPVPLEVFSARLAKALGKIGNTTLLNRERLISQLGRLDGLQSLGERTLIRRERLRSLTEEKHIIDWDDADEPGMDARITEWLHNVEASHDMVVYQADPTRTPWTVRCLRQADRTLLVGRADGNAGLGQVESRLFERPVMDLSDDYSRERALVLLHESSSGLPKSSERWLRHRPVQRHFQCRLTSDADFSRLARMLVGTHVSLVFSGGGARGAAHVGVIKALAEHGVPIDSIGGTSFGAIMAAGPALGWDHEELREGIRRTLVAPGKPLDYTAPYTALTKGARATEQIRSIFGDVRIEDLWLPYFCVSSNISRGETVVHDRGHLWRAVRSSVAIPGILPPVRSPEGDVLIDGAVMNNMPADVMRQRWPGGQLLAVNLRAPVGLPTGDLTDEGVLSGWPLFLRRLNPFAARPSVPSILDLILRTAETGNVISSQMQETAADLTFHPAVDQYRMLDFSAFDQLIEAGYVEATERLKEWPALSSYRDAT